MIKIGLGISLAIMSLVTAFLTPKTQAQIFPQKRKPQLSHELTLRQYKLTTQSKDEEPPAESEPLDFSSLGRSGQQTAGESRGSCPPMNLPLTAIAPKNNDSKTIFSHPQWWFYIPYSAAQVSKVEFVLQDEARKDIIRESIVLPETLPYISTTIPQTHGGLKLNHWYRWYLKVYCSAEENSVPLFVSGWVQRITLNASAQTLDSELSLTAIDYAQQDLWLDAINLLLSTQMSSYSEVNLFHVWQQIIRSPDIDLKLPLPKRRNIVTN